MWPLIGITARRKTLESRGMQVEVQATEQVFIRSVAAAGGIPLVLAPSGNDVGPVLDVIDGLVLTGGGDIDPARYGSRPTASTYEVDSERDEFEISLVREAQRRLLPTLAICRGMQVVNVACGGTLVGDLPTERGIEGHRLVGDAIHQAHQMVTLDADSRLAGVIGTVRFGVNSIHHQAVDTPGEGLRVVGTANDGVVEAIEWMDPSWSLCAVQWHPEFLTETGDAAALALFDWLVAAATTAAHHS